MKTASAVARATLFGRYVAHMAMSLRRAAVRPGLERLRDVYLGPVSVDGLRRPRRLGADAARAVRGRRFAERHQRPLLYLPFLGASAFHEPDEFARRLEQHHAEILADFRRAEANLATHPEAHLLRGGTWQLFRLYRGGVKDDANCVHCPDTTRIIESLPMCGSHMGMAYFSVLEPGTHIRPHCGPTNARRRYHLTLEACEGATLRVGDQVRTWEPGRCLVFDDSFEHEVAHVGDRRRVVLLVDLWHPELTLAERAALSASVLREDMDQIFK